MKAAPHAPTRTQRIVVCLKGLEEYRLSYSPGQELAAIATVLRWGCDPRLSFTLKDAMRACGMILKLAA